MHITTSLLVPWSRCVLHVQTCSFNSHLVVDESPDIKTPSASRVANSIANTCAEANECIFDSYKRTSFVHRLGRAKVAGGQVALSTANSWLVCKKLFCVAGVRDLRDVPSLLLARDMQI
jgi:hypothetical protein